jgi:hypothetical protein
MKTLENIGGTSGDRQHHRAKRSNGREQDYAVAAIGYDHEKTKAPPRSKAHGSNRLVHGTALATGGTLMPWR